MNKFQFNTIQEIYKRLFPFLSKEMSIYLDHIEDGGASISIEISNTSREIDLIIPETSDYVYFYAKDYNKNNSHAGLATNLDELIKLFEWAVSSDKEFPSETQDLRIGKPR